MKPPGSPLLAHLERHLGPIQTGWRLPGADSVFVVRFDDRPLEGAVTYTTVGLSETLLHQEDGGNLRQELLFCCWAPERDDDIVGLLMVVAGDVLQSEQAFAHGQVLGPAGPLVPDGNVEALYCTAPVYFDDEFHAFRGVDPPVIIVWLVPLTRDEAAAAQTDENFEDLLVEADPDFLDLSRESIL
ncbi:MAG TPA: suppressor of fused domain protein [Thermoanaerobaculia bacterium]|nr:suppressor of fused domain protein [Thermoanaerobaculia bacterium]